MHGNTFTTMDDVALDVFDVPLDVRSMRKVSIARNILSHCVFSIFIYALDSVDLIRNTFSSDITIATNVKDTASTSMIQGNSFDSSRSSITLSVGTFGVVENKFHRSCWVQSCLKVENALIANLSLNFWGYQPMAPIIQTGSTQSATLLREMAYPWYLDERKTALARTCRWKNHNCISCDYRSGRCMGFLNKIFETVAALWNEMEWKYGTTKSELAAVHRGHNTQLESAFSETKTRLITLKNAEDPKPASAPVAETPSPTLLSAAISAPHQTEQSSSTTTTNGSTRAHVTITWAEPAGVSVSGTTRPEDPSYGKVARHDKPATEHKEVNHRVLGGGPFVAQVPAVPSNFEHPSHGTQEKLFRKPSSSGSFSVGKSSFGKPKYVVTRTREDCQGALRFLGAGMFCCVFLFGNVRHRVLLAASALKRLVGVRFPAPVAPVRPRASRAPRPNRPVAVAPIVAPFVEIPVAVPADDLHEAEADPDGALDAAPPTDLQFVEEGCSVCLEQNIILVTLHPCNHACICLDCAAHPKLGNKCPLCRVVIEDKSLPLQI
eukprot:TRINITY_DN10_c0_g1_i1.p1 TRINITY_DN10_c0_g1~~TRINITY_DN10_c0_g1_i1.p1  ORF type:complete len:550 (+),score=62.48 TRINITY_DN10_c0_g1_i1:899-2548(+)